MARVIRHDFKRRYHRHHQHWPGLIGFALGLAVVLSMLPLVGPVFEGISLPRGARFIDTRNKIETIDGDTVRYQSDIYRLVGFNTPETGTGAQCRSERALADKASRRLRELLASGEARLQKVRCACAPGTEGTKHCNHGRLCATVTVSGIDVGETLIAEGLAERYICRGNSCPPRRNWCS